MERLDAALGGRYAVERELGVGGMATVYLADDLRHDRKVALKVLKPELAAVIGADRFLAEIKTTAGLQHPHILPLFDSGEAEGFLYYVMPYIEGETLRDLLDREKQLPVDVGVGIATDVAEALDHAHRNGVIHRDVKPENILLRDGRAVVADFGIALALSAAGGGRLTETGLSLGTPHYMSPEQAAAEKDLDRRTDIYGLGCVLYEMLSGDPPHTGSSAQQIVMKIVTDDARPLRELRRSVPQNVADAVAKALEKLPADRFMSARDFGAALADPGFRDTGSARAVAAPPARFGRLVLGAALLSPLLLALALWGWVRTGERPAADVPRLEARLYMGPDLTVSTGDGFALSPAGDRLAFAARAETGARHVWVRSLDSEEATRVPSSENGAWPFWSPDGRWLAFTAAGRLRVVELAGGTARALCEADNPGRGAWSADGVILFPRDGVIYRTEAGGGECRPVSRPGDPEGQHGNPAFLPGGRRFLFSGASGTVGLRVADLETGEHELVVGDATNSIFVAPDWILYTGPPQGSTDVRGLLPVLAQRLDLSTMEPVGDATPVFAGVSSPGGWASYSASANGVLIGVRDPTESPPLAWVGRNGVAGDAIPVPNGPWTFSPSRDGRRVAMGGWGLWVHDVGRGVSRRMLVDFPERRATWHPAWSAGDSVLAFSAVLQGPNAVYLHHLGRGTLTTLFEEPTQLPAAVAWAPDGGELAYWVRAIGEARTAEVWVHSFPEDARERLFGTSATRGASRFSLEFSPDGRSLLYTTTDTGSEEVYVRSYPDPGAPRRVSSNGGSRAHWGPDGRTIFFLSPTDQVMAVPVGAGGADSLGTPRVVQDDDRYTDLFGVGPDGGSFLRLLRPPDSDVPELRLITGWQERAGGR